VVSGLLGVAEELHKVLGSILQAEDRQPQWEVGGHIKVAALEDSGTLAVEEGLHRRMEAGNDLKPVAEAEVHMIEEHMYPAGT